MEIVATIGDTIQIAAPFDPVLKKALDNGNNIFRLLRALGLPTTAATFGMYATYFETAAYSSPLYLKHNNASGIKYAGQKGAVRGDNGYAWWPGGLQGWAAAYAHELTKGSNPAGAKTIEDFAARLKANRYYEAPLQQYIDGMKRARLVLRTMPAAEWDYNQDTKYNPDTGISTDKPAMDWYEEWKKLNGLQKGGIIAAAALIVIVAVKR